MILALSSCMEEDEGDFALEELDRNLQARTPAKGITTDIHEEPSREEPNRTGRLKGRLVKEAERIRDPAFRLGYIRENNANVSLGQRTVLEILNFRGPAQGDALPRLMPLDMKEIHRETLHMVQRSPPAAKNRIFKDFEIFLVFKAAYENISHADRVAVVQQWKARVGEKEPGVPEDKIYPLFWLRENPIFWKRGGHFWWWAAHALMGEGGLKVLKDGRVFIRLPGAKRSFHS